MHWHGEFRAALFGEWSGAGLPDPAHHLERYRAVLAAATCPLDLPYTSSGPLDRAVVDRVFGFGAVIGGVITDLLGVPDAHASAVVDWCGRFNLGISLVDYVCDESGRLDALQSIEPFRGLAGEIEDADAGDHGPPAPDGELRAEERVVARLATEVLRELTGATGNRSPGAVADLYRAEVAVARRRFGPGGDPVTIERELATKSVGPFVLMAARAAASGPCDEDAARRLGTAIGTLVWLVDDARDLWLDLEHGAWNLFLLRATQREPALAAAPPSPFRDAAIARTLAVHDVARREARQGIEAFLGASAALGGDPDRTVAALGLVGAALAVW